MSAPETPRTWTMRQTGEPGVGWLVDGEMPLPGEVVKTYEAGPVDAERELLREIAEDAANPVFEDERVKYVEIQIDRETWEQLVLLHNRLSGGEGSDDD